MVNYCVAPGCEGGRKRKKKKKNEPGSGGDSVVVAKDEETNSKQPTATYAFHFPSDAKLRRIWELKVPRNNFKASSNSVLCDKHFVDDDFVEASTDTNTYRKRKKKREGLTPKRKQLKKCVIPSLWAEWPEHLSKTPKKRPMKRSSQEFHTLTCELLKQQKKKQENIQLDTFSSIVEMLQKMKSKCSLLGIIQAKKGDAFLFLSLTDGEPQVKHCLRVLESFTFEIWLNGKMIHPNR